MVNTINGELLLVLVVFSIDILTDLLIFIYYYSV